jgi:hypothetical protein
METAVPLALIDPHSIAAAPLSPRHGAFKGRRRFASHRLFPLVKENNTTRHDE